MSRSRKDAKGGHDQPVKTVLHGNHIFPDGRLETWGQNNFNYIKKQVSRRSRQSNKKVINELLKEID